MVAFVDPPSPEAVARELSHELMSPYCPGRTVASCPSGQARQMEDDILAQARSGQSREEIKETLLARFGKETLGSNDNPAVVYGTLIIALLGALMIALFARRRLVARRAGKAEAQSWATEHAAPSVQASRTELDDLEDELDRVEDF